MPNLVIALQLSRYFPDVSYQHLAGKYVAEFGGDIPASLANTLRLQGADVSRYNHRGVVSTVVSF